MGVESAIFQTHTYTCGRNTPAFFLQYLHINLSAHFFPLYPPIRLFSRPLPKPPVSSHLEGIPLQSREAGLQDVYVGFSKFQNENSFLRGQFADKYIKNLKSNRGFPVCSMQQSQTCDFIMCTMVFLLLFYCTTLINGHIY